MRVPSRGLWVATVTLVALAALAGFTPAPAQARPLARSLRPIRPVRPLRSLRTLPPLRPAVHPSRAPFAAPPSPPLAVQVTGVRPGRGRLWAATNHAIHRDALPGLYACAAALPGPRGYVHVELSHRETGQWVAEVSAARRDRALEACVQRAAERVVVPPSEDDALPMTPVTSDTPSDNHSHLAPAVEPAPPGITAPANTPPGMPLDTPPEVPAEDIVAFDVAFGLSPLTPRRP